MEKKTTGFSQTSAAGLSSFFGQSATAVNVEWLAGHTCKNQNYIIPNSLSNCVILLHICLYIYIIYKVGWDSDSLRAGRAGDRLPERARFFAPLRPTLGLSQPSVQRVSCLFPVGKAAGVWR